MYWESEKKLRELMKTDLKTTEDEVNNLFDSILSGATNFDIPLEWECSTCLETFYDQQLMDIHKRSCGIVEVTDMVDDNSFQLTYLEDIQATAHSDNMTKQSIVASYLDDILRINEASQTIQTSSNEMRVSFSNEKNNHITFKYKCIKCANEFNSSQFLLEHDATCKRNNVTISVDTVLSSFNKTPMPITIGNIINPSIEASIGSHINYCIESAAIENNIGKCYQPAVEPLLTPVIKSELNVSNSDLHPEDDRLKRSISLGLTQMSLQSLPMLPKTEVLKNWICKKCAEVFASKEQLNEHKYSMHRDPNKTYKFQINYHRNESGEYVCNFCDKAFATRGKVNGHVRNHTGEKALCHLDGKWFSSRNNLLKHYRTVHLKEKNYQCTVCEKRYDSSYRLKIHFQTIHQGIRQFVCRFCANRFMTSSALTRHEKTIHSDEKRHVCNICTRGFKVAENLRAHMITHAHCRTHTCVHCGAEFSRKSKLHLHIEVSHGVIL